MCNTKKSHPAEKLKLGWSMIFLAAALLSTPYCKQKIFRTFLHVSIFTGMNYLSENKRSIHTFYRSIVVHNKIIKTNLIIYNTLKKLFAFSYMNKVIAKLIFMSCSFPKGNVLNKSAIGQYESV